MGEISELMLDGFMCEQCGEIIGDLETGEGQGFPGLCAACQAEAGDDDEVYSLPNKSKPIQCTDCQRRFKNDAAWLDHYRAKHNKNIPMGE